MSIQTKSPSSANPAPQSLQRTAEGYVSSGFFVVRTPLLPVQEWLGPDGAVPPAQAVLPTVDSADRLARLRGHLAAIVERPEVQEALFLASPTLAEHVDSWRKAPESERGQKVERTLVRYLGRMALRSTPFGLFAGCTLGEIGHAQAGPHLAIELEGRAAYTRHTRLDGDLMSALADALAADRALREQLEYRRNTSLYPLGGRWRYVETGAPARNEDDGEEAPSAARSYHLTAVEPSAYLDAALRAATEPVRFGDLRAAVAAADPALDAAEVDAFLHELIDHQLLQPLLKPALTDSRPLGSLHKTLTAVGGAAGAAAGVLAAAQDLIADMDAQGLGRPLQSYRALHQLLDARPVSVELSRLVQADLYKPARRAAMSEALAQEVLRGVELLHLLTPLAENGALARFRDRFRERYEDREVPLLAALDEELGIGFGEPRRAPEPLLHGLGMPARTAEDPPFTARDAALRELIFRALATKTQALELTDGDLTRLAERRPMPLPDCFAAMVTVLGGATALADGSYRVLLDRAMGPSGATLLGRFCHLHPRLEQVVKDHLRAEEALRPHARFAEIVHLPEGRLANILARPRLRELELPFLGPCTVPPAQQLDPADLVVSVVGQRVVLRSARHGFEVLPRLSSAHNHSSQRNLGVYRFLCALQYQGSAGGLVWSWGSMAGARFLPRLTRGRFILVPARWQLDAEELRRLQAGTAAGRFAAVQELRQALRWPRYIALADGDNLLPVDLDSPLCVEALADLIGHRRAALIEELLGVSPEQLSVHGPEGAFRHELVIPYIRKQPAGGEERSADLELRRPERGDRAPRAYAPGSEWLYAKLYTGLATADTLLRQLLPELVRDARAVGVDRWFFIRYSDPDWHLRVRFHGPPRILQRELLPLLHERLAPCLADGRVRRLQLDTYEPEVERYGGLAGLDLAERIFEVDSDAVLALLPHASGDGGLSARWKIALASTDLLLEELLFAGRRADADMLAQKGALLSALRGSFEAEFSVDTPLRKRIGQRFRKERAELAALLAALRSEQPPKPLAALRERSQKLVPLVHELHRLRQTQCLEQRLETLLGSYLHMHLNRMFRSAGRAQELVVYELLLKLAHSQAHSTQKGDPHEARTAPSGIQ